MLVAFDLPSIFRCGLEMARLMCEELRCHRKATAEALETAHARLVYALTDDPDTRDMLLLYRDEDEPEEDGGKFALGSKLLRDCDCADADPEAREGLIELAGALMSWQNTPEDMVEWLESFSRALFKIQPAERRAVPEGGKAAAQAPADGKEENPPPAPANGEGDDAAMPSVNRNGKLILEILHNRYPTLQTVQEIHDALRMRSPSVYLSDRTIRPALKKLIDDNLAERPQGARKGATLTIAGKRLAERLLRASRTLPANCR
jgi:hypothetical protein